MTKMNKKIHVLEIKVIFLSKYAMFSNNHNFDHVKWLLTKCNPLDPSTVLA